MRVTPRAPRDADAPLAFVTSRLLDRHGLPHLFSTRHCPGIARPTDLRAEGEEPADEDLDVPAFLRRQAD